MGIKGFTKLIKRHSEFTNKKISDYNGRWIAMDTSNQLFKFKIAILGGAGKHISRSDGKVTSHLLGIFYKNCMLLNEGIIPVWVFDGKPPEIKKETIYKRKVLKKKAEQELKTNQNLTADEKISWMKKVVTIKDTDIRDLMLLFEYMGIPFVQANRDAEAQCAANQIAKICYGTSTEDSDLFLFGGGTLIKNLSSKGYVIELRLEKILEDLKLTREELIDVAILLGTDYCSPPKGLGPVKAYDEYMEAKKQYFDLIISKTKSIKNPEITELAEKLKEFPEKYKLTQTDEKLVKKLAGIYKVPTIMQLVLDWIDETNEIAIEEGRLKPFEVPEGFLEQAKLAKEYYLHTYVIKPESLDLNWREPDYKKLLNFLGDEHEFDKNKLDKKLEELQKSYNKYMEKSKIVDNDGYLKLNDSGESWIQVNKKKKRN